MRLLLVSTAAALSVPGTHQRPIRIAPGLEVTVLEADEGKPGGVHTGTVTWSGGRALAGYLSENAHLVRGKRGAQHGVVIKKTKTAFVIGIHGDNLETRQVSAHVEQFGDYLASQGM